MMRVILILLMALALIAPATAEAGLKARIDKAQAAAVAYWDKAPNCPVRTVHTEPLMNAGAAMEAGNCTIYIAPGWWALQRPYYQKLCSVYVHEWGHLLGYEHTDDPADVMYHGTVPLLKECKRTPKGVRFKRSQ